MPTIKKEKVDVPPGTIAAVVLYDIILVLATLAAMYYITPWAIFMLIASASIDDEEVTIDAENKSELKEALWEIDL